MSSLYVASSWRNTRYPDVLWALADAGISFYDFRQPRPGDNGFAWTDVWADIKAVGDWRTDSSSREIVSMLDHPIARAGFESDMGALRDARATLLVMPCGRSAHLELGYAVGAKKPTAILLPFGRAGIEPELMWRMADFLTDSIDEAVLWAHRVLS